MAIIFKACPKCNGDLNLAEDTFGKYVSCLQCGYLKDVTRDYEEERNPEPVTNGGRKAA